MKTTKRSITELLNIMKRATDDDGRWIALAEVLREFMESQGVDLDYTEDGEVEKPTRI